MTFEIEISGSLGPCLDLDRLQDVSGELKKFFEELKKDFEKFFDPEGIAKKIRTITPKQLRENNNVEKPIKIKRKK